jgi:hypothetical protein
MLDKFAGRRRRPPSLTWPAGRLEIEVGSKQVQPSTTYGSTYVKCPGGGAMNPMHGEAFSEEKLILTGVLGTLDNDRVSYR